MSEELLRFGTRLIREGDRLVRVVGRDGEVQVAIAWQGGGMARLDVAGYRAGVTLTIDGARAGHPLLGEVHTLRRGGGGEPIAVMTALDWTAPSEIPAIDRPAALPAGTGTLLLSTIARLARGGLRYAGPYPTEALWGSLAQAFRADGRVEDFVRDAATRWTGADRSPVAVDFAPAPFERVAAGPGVFAQLRDSLERVVIDGLSYDRGAGVRRLVDDEAQLWFGDRRYATVARFTAEGALVERPALPAVTGSPVGEALPPPLVDALASLIADLVPAPLASLAPEALRAVPIAWGDAGAAAAADRGDRLVVHAALWHAVAPHGLARVALALAEALAPLAAARAISGAGASPSR